MRRWTWGLAAGCTLACGFLLPLLIPADHLSPWGALGLLLGGGLGAIIVASVARGTRLCIDEAGTVHYFLGHRENLRLPIHAVRRWGAVDCGILRGIGADCPLEAIELLHRKGVRLTQLRDQQRQLGFALVFEFQDPAHLPELEALSRAFADPPPRD
jgi:hypothetical protein